MKQNILFIPAAIKSHIEPALFVADLLSDEHQIYFAVTSSAHAEIVIKNGFHPVLNGSYRVCAGMEAPYLKERGRKSNTINLLYLLIREKIYWERKEELDNIIKKVNPKAIILDIFNSFDFFTLYSYFESTRILFYNPMLSTYKVGSYPAVWENNWKGAKGQFTFKNSNFKLKKVKNLLTSPITALLSYYSRTHKKRLFKLSNISPRYKIDDKNTLVIAFQNIPEILLAPLELELSPEIQKKDQHYIGLCIKENRFDTAVDTESLHLVNTIPALKERGNKIIYCSFGTFHQGSLRSILKFMNNLLDAIAEMPQVLLICSVNKLVIETIRTQRKVHENILFYTKVKQLDILKYADIHISHGGLGSIKESIFYKVPLLIYPLDLRYDQNGNGLKIEHHGLGLRGNLAEESSDNLKDKILKILNTPAYKERAARFQGEILNKYHPTSTKELLLSLIS